MRTFLGVCFLIIGGWAVSVADTVAFLDFMPESRHFLYGAPALVALVFIGLGLLCMRSRRGFALGVTLFLASLSVWLTAAGYSALHDRAPFSRLIPPNFDESVADTGFGFMLLAVQTVIAVALIVKFRKAAVKAKTVAA
ncbi:hypothetical protein [Neisseria chenwenguii]|uniref:Uncharacterized protein n=1 Tax=Neisseria chenwenguii TaxID=1853278 RepID=A0A220S3R0_9NEIS|nr:hypothetical protein [Neisseria chenwenguii]ASK28032.1 hypothetical protein BG910_10095 [Neisseria chenwenguii]ROV57183.1 hypothetical protein EGS38_00355 [Neisseria chenwenguii]